MTQPVRVMRLIARMNVGGPAIQITGLMKNLSLPEFEQLLITGFCDQDEMDYLEINQFNFPRTRLSGFGRSINLFSDLRVLLEIRRQILSFRPDIVHTHTAKAGLLGRIAAISTFKGPLLVHTFHGHLLHGYFGKFKTNLVILTERILARLTDKLVAVGEHVRDELLEARIGSFDQYKVIGPGLEIGELPERVLSLKHFDLPEDTFIVTWIGRLVRVKAPHRILEVSEACIKRKLKVKFVIAGEGPLANELKELAKKMHLQIAFLGWQSNIEKILSFSDLVMLTSENEGTPVALIQAQMAGIPILATDVGSTSEVMINKKSGFCLNFSAENFADIIEMLATNIDIKTSFGATGRAYARDNFSLNRLVSDHSELYRDLINQSKS